MRSLTMFVLLGLAGFGATAALPSQVHASWFSDLIRNSWLPPQQQQAYNPMYQGNPYGSPNPYLNPYAGYAQNPYAMFAPYGPYGTPPYSSYGMNAYPGYYDYSNPYYSMSTMRFGPNLSVGPYNVLLVPNGAYGGRFNPYTIRR